MDSYNISGMSAAHINWSLDQLANFSGYDQNKNKVKVYGDKELTFLTIKSRNDQTVSKMRGFMRKWGHWNYSHPLKALQTWTEKAKTFTAINPDLRSEVQIAKVEEAIANILPLLDKENYTPEMIEIFQNSFNNLQDIHTILSLPKSEQPFVMSPELKTQLQLTVHHEQIHDNPKAVASILDRLTNEKSTKLDSIIVKDPNLRVGNIGFGAPLNFIKDMNRIDQLTIEGNHFELVSEASKHANDLLGTQVFLNAFKLINQEFCADIIDEKIGSLMKMHADDMNDDHSPWNGFSPAEHRGYTFDVSLSQDKTKVIINGTIPMKITTFGKDNGWVSFHRQVIIDREALNVPVNALHSERLSSMKVYDHTTDLYSTPEKAQEAIEMGKSFFLEKA